MSKQNVRKGNRNAKSKTRSAESQNKEVKAKYTKDNDPSWYAANEQILKDSATLAFSTMQGSKLSVPNMPSRMPGIMRINVVGVPGLSDGSTSAVNIASRNIYSYVRHANSGASNYEAPDLMLYLLAMDQAYMYYSWMRRIYCTFRTYFQRNYYTPKWIIESMDVDYDDLESKLSDFRLYINIFAQKCGSLVTPSGMTFLTRHSWLNSNIFADSPTDKAQFIYFNTPCFGIYSPKTSSKGGELIYQDVKVSGLITLDRIIEFGNTILEPLIADEDINIMSGDILKAFGDNVNKLALIHEDDVILPVYSPEVLTQVQNLREIPLSTENISVSQNDGYLVTNFPTLGYVTDDITKLKLEEDGILNMPMANPTPGDVMVATRLTGVLEVDAGNTKYNIASCGTEICTGVTIYTLHDSGKELLKSGSGYLVTVKSSGTGDNTDTVKMTALKAIVEQLANISVFNSHPKTLIAIYGSNGSLLYSRLAMELDNYTVINPSDIKQMDDVAVLNEFDVPQMGVYKA